MCGFPYIRYAVIPDPIGQLAELIVYTSTRVDLYSHQILLASILGNDAMYNVNLSLS